MALQVQTLPQLSEDLPSLFMMVLWRFTIIVLFLLLYSPSPYSS